MARKSPMDRRLSAKPTLKTLIRAAKYKFWFLDNTTMCIKKELIEKICRVLKETDN